MSNAIVQSKLVQSTHGVGVHDLGYVIQRLQAAVGAAINGDWMTFSMNIVGIFGKFIWSFKGKIPGVSEAQKAAKDNKDLPMTLIIDLTMLVISLTDIFNGFLSPSNGADFDSGATSFESAGKSLQLADPKRYWRGDAADAYAALNAQLESLATRMQSYDGQMADLVDAQAKDVKHMHDIVSELLMACVAAQGTAVLLYVSATPAISYKFQMAFAAATLSALVGEEIKTAQAANDKADAAKAISDSYANVADIAEAIEAKLKSPTPVGIPMSDGTKATEGVGSTVPSVEAVSGDMSGQGALPDTASLVSAIGSGRQQHAVSAFTEDSQSSRVGSSQASQTVDETAAFGFTTAHLSRFSELVGHAAESSGGVSGHSQTARRAQRPASGEPEDQGAATVPTPADVGGASAAGNAERAPVAPAAVGPDHAREPSPLKPAGASG